MQNVVDQIIVKNRISGEQYENIIFNSKIRNSNIGLKKHERNEVKAFLLSIFIYMKNCIL